MLDTGQVVDRYTVETLLGEGGMASVYRVRHNTLGSRHALKLLKVQSEAIRRRLVTEGQVQASLRHPNVVAVTDVLFFGEQPGLVMELVEGPTLHDWLGQYAPTIPEAEALFKGILAGVSRAHRAGVLHRDLKPGNVLLEPLDGQWVPKVADFGLAKVLADDPAHSQTRSGLPMGTPQYMAPEQIRNAKDVDQRADIWALGCILYELLTGVRPFDGPDIIELYTAIGRGQYRPIEEVVPEVPPHVAMAIRGCLSANADERIPDCDTLRAVLAGAYTQGGADEARAALTTGLRGTPLVPDRTGPPAKAPPPDAPSLEEPPRSAATFAPMSLPPVPGPPPPAATTVAAAPVAAAAAAQGPGPTAPARPRQLALLAVLGGGGLAVLGFAIVAFLLLRDGDETKPAATATTEPTAATEAAEATATPAPTEPTPTEEAATPPEAPPATKPSATKPTSLTPRAGASRPTTTPAATPAATPTPARTTGRVVITGEVSEVVLHGQDKDYPPGAVPPGTYTATATFANRGPASVDPFVVRANETTTLFCEPTFQMCRPK